MSLELNVPSTGAIKPGAREAVRAALAAGRVPAGAGGVGISIWDSAQACRRYRDSDVETRRQAIIDPFVLEERSSVYTGREPSVPGR